MAGYTEIEKLNIATRFLVPKQLKAHGLTEKNIEFTRSSILCITRRYTREAGVRNLERQIAKLCRKVAKEVLKKGKTTKVRIGKRALLKHLGPYQLAGTFSQSRWRSCPARVS
jgi:ATP-dependent Lon protease